MKGKSKKVKGKREDQQPRSHLPFCFVSCSYFYLLPFTFLLSSVFCVATISGIFSFLLDKKQRAFRLCGFHLLLNLERASAGRDSHVTRNYLSLGQDHACARRLRGRASFETFS
jgi:hypothetical protein